MAARRAQRQRPHVPARRAGWRVAIGCVEAARAGALFRRHGHHPAGATRQSAAQDVQSQRVRRPRPEVRGHAGALSDRNGESRLRPGGGRSGGRQSQRVRDVFPGAPSVLHRRVRHLSMGLQRRLHPVLFTSHRPPAAWIADAGRRRVCRAAGTNHDHRRRQVDWTDRCVLGRRAGGGDAAGGGHRGVRQCAPQRGGRTRLAVFGVASATGVHRSVVARIHVDDNQPEVQRVGFVPAGQRRDRGTGLRLAASAAASV